jgi:hypothetical protein
MAAKKIQSQVVEVAKIPIAKLQKLSGGLRFFASSDDPIDTPEGLGSGESNTETTGSITFAMGNISVAKRKQLPRTLSIFAAPDGPAKTTKKAVKAPTKKASKAPNKKL